MEALRELRAPPASLQVAGRIDLGHTARDDDDWPSESGPGGLRPEHPTGRVLEASRMLGLVLGQGEGDTSS